MKVIDLEKWERTTHYEFFKRMDYPHHSICTNLDITQFLGQTRKLGLPFYYTMIYCATAAMNKTQAFRLRMRADESVVLHDTLHPSFTDMEKGTELFKMVTVDLTDCAQAFVLAAREKSAGQQAYFVREDVEGRDDLIYFSCCPWVAFTGITHTISFNRYDSIPRVAWGKYFEENGKILLPFSVQAHHSFVDGIHMGQYVDNLQKGLQMFGQEG